MWTAFALVALLATAPEALDRIVALVDENPILLSDVERVRELGLVAAREGESEAQLRRRVLDELIVQRLRIHEVERDGSLPVAEAELERQVESVRTRWQEAAREGETFEVWLGRRGLDVEGLRRLLARQLRILLYIEERLGPRVFVDVEEITRYYEDELVPQWEAAGEPVPPLPEVRESLRQLLRQRGLDTEIREWTERLRSRADIVDRLDRDEEMPPVSRRLGAPLPGVDAVGNDPETPGTMPG